MSTIYKKTILKSNNRRFTFNIESYNSANDVATDCENRQMKDGGWHTPEYSSWSGAGSHEEAMELLRNGYDPVVKEFKEKTRLTVKGDGKRISFKNNIQGFVPIVPLALNGVPNCMVDVHMKPIKCKVIDVYYDMTVSWDVSSEQIIENGKNILGAIFELESQGYRFNLYALQTYTDDDSADMLMVKIKSSNQPFDLKRMSFPLTHPAFFRIIGFDWYSKNPDSKYRYSYGTGFGYKFGDRCAGMMQQALGENAVYISAAKMVGREQKHIKEILIDAGNSKNSKN